MILTHLPCTCSVFTYVRTRSIHSPSCKVLTHFHHTRSSLAICKTCSLFQHEFTSMHIRVLNNLTYSKAYHSQPSPVSTTVFIFLYSPKPVATQVIFLLMIFKIMDCKVRKNHQTRYLPNEMPERSQG